MKIKIIFLSLVACSTTVTPLADFLNKATQTATDVAGKATSALGGVDNLVSKDIPALIATITAVVNNVQSSINVFEQNIKAIGAAGNPNQVIVPFYTMVDAPLETLHALEGPLDVVAQLINNLGANIVTVFDSKSGASLVKVASDIQNIKNQISDMRIRVQKLLPILKESTLGISQGVVNIGAIIGGSGI